MLRILVDAMGGDNAPQEIVKEFYRLRRRHRPVVDIPGNDDGVRLMLLRQLCDLCKDIFLVFPEIPVYQLQSDMQVG